MRLPRLPLLFAALMLAPVLGGAQTPARAGQATADDIVDRMNKAERAVLERLKTLSPLMEV
jgi:hypothetical protein